MPVFKQSGGQLSTVREVKIQLEKNIQELTEQNIETVFNLKFVTTEFQLNNLRIDTLAFDPETNAFIIIEYKRDKSFSVVDQGFAYLSLMLNNKADFILEYNEKMQKSLKRNDVDWSQSRVLFLAHSFTKHQQQAINFKDLPIELWEVRKYENDLISYTPLKALQTAESINTISKDQTVTKVSREVKSYNPDRHLLKTSEKVRKMFEMMKEYILALDERFEENTTKNYISYKINSKNLVGFEFRKHKIWATFSRTEPTDLNDPEKKTSYRKNSMEHFNQHMTNMEIKTEDDVEYFTMLLKQVLKRHSEEGII